MADCSGVIVNYNAGPLLAEAVHSALEAGANEVIVSDNGSADGSAEALAETPDPRIKVIFNGANLGFAAGCNRGLAAARCAEILFLNPDARLASHSLERLQAVIESDPAIGMAGPLLLNPDGSEQRGGRRKIPDLASGFGFGMAPAWLRRRLPRLLPDFNQDGAPVPDTPVDVEAISGGCMLVRREALDAVGGWDEGYFLHVEDLDLCMRFTRAGYRIVFVPGAEATHIKGASTGGRAVFVEWHKHRGMLRFYQKHMAAGRSPLTGLLVRAGVGLRFLLVTARIKLAKLAPRL